MHGSCRKRRREGVARGNRYCSRLDDRMRGWIKPFISIGARHRVELERQRRDWVGNIAVIGWLGC
jgi:hypothetical protein